MVKIYISSSHLGWGPLCSDAEGGGCWETDGNVYKLHIGVNDSQF